MSGKLTAAQQALRQQLIEEAKKLQYLDEQPIQSRLWEYHMGEIVEPAVAAQTVDGWSRPERRYKVYYAPNYGVVAPRLVTSNGSTYSIAGCLTDNARFEISPNVSKYYKKEQ